jgi:hypothetical protein
VSETKRAKNRVHVDLVDPDPSAIDKLVALGATVVGNHRLGSHRWTVMQDPEGTKFCTAGKMLAGYRIGAPPVGQRRSLLSS